MWNSGLLKAGTWCLYFCIVIENEIMLQLGSSDRGRSEEGSLTWRCLGSAGVLYLGSLGVSETGIERLCSE